MFEKGNVKDTKSPIGIVVTAYSITLQICAIPTERNFRQTDYPVIVNRTKGLIALV